MRETRVIISIVYMRYESHFSGSANENVIILCFSKNKNIFFCSRPSKIERRKKKSFIIKIKKIYNGFKILSWRI